MVEYIKLTQNRIHNLQINVIPSMSDTSFNKNSIFRITWVRSHICSDSLLTIIVGFICQNKSIMMGSSLVLWTDARANCAGFLSETINIGWRRLMWRIFMMKIYSCRFITSQMRYVITYECPKCFRGWLWCTVGFTRASDICITHFSNKLLLMFSSSQSSGWTDSLCMPNVWWNS